MYFKKFGLPLMALTALLLAVLLDLTGVDQAKAQGPEYDMPGPWIYEYDPGPCPGCNRYGYGYTGQTPYGRSEYAGAYIEWYHMGRYARGAGLGQNDFYPGYPIRNNPPPYYGNSYYKAAQWGYMSGYHGFYPYPSNGVPGTYWGR